MATADPLTISLLGGGDEIGASSALVQAGETSVLVDCGVRFEPGRPLPDLAELTDRRLDAILVTHAHTDHTGALPVVHEAFPAVPVYMSPPTIDLVRILEKDALKLMDAGWEREGEVPLYSEAVVQSLFHVVRGVSFGQSFTVGEFEVTTLPASHILGASMIHLATPAGRVLFTGDYSVEAQRTVPALDRPALSADVVVTESTYGNRLHADRRTAERRLIERVAKTVAGGGRVLIPAFAIGRAQEVLLILRQAFERGELPDVPVFVDGMVRAVCEVYAQHPRYVTSSLARRIRRGHPFYDERIRPVGSPRERREVLASGPSVIVASSGMLSGGPSSYYAGEMAPNERDAILITGYQDEESPGRALLSLADAEGPRTLRLGEREVEVACEFTTYGLSAHADRMQMAGLLESLRPATVILVHGDESAKRSLAGSISCRDVVCGANGDRIERRYSGGRRGRPPPRPPIQIDERQARELVAGAPGGTIRVEQVAESWFGPKPPRIQVERLVARLAELGVVVRDDRRRGLLRVQALDDSEEALAEELKTENPKGRLLEYLTRLSADPPVLTHDPLLGGRHRAELAVHLEDRTLESGAAEAGSLRLAEQLAARALLEVLDREEDRLDLEEVGEEEEERLREQNPKGRLLERLAGARLPPAVIEVTPLPSGAFAGRARLALPDGRGLRSRDYRAATGKAAEQAAAAEILAGLPDLPSPVEGAPGDRTDGEMPLPAGPDPRVRLNEYRQRGQLRDFGYEVEDARGPAHRPEFAVRAWADLPDGERIVSEPGISRVKKEARRLAAELLVRRLLDR